MQAGNINFDLAIKDGGSAVLKSLSASASALQDKFKGVGSNIGSGLVSAIKYGSVAIAAGTGFVAKKVLDIGGDFESLQTRLETSLGSIKAAAAGFKLATDLASSTPFSVREWTEAFEQFKQTGLIATEKELIKFGDLAAAKGAKVGDVASAIVAASTGEFERLKQFHVVARANGDKLKMTYAGQTHEIDNNTKAIREYLLALGDSAGIKGGMERMSKAVKGQISNLGDTWDFFLKNIFDSGGSNILSKGVSIISSLITRAGEAFDILLANGDKFKVAFAPVIGIAQELWTNISGLFGGIDSGTKTLDVMNSGFTFMQDIMGMIAPALDILRPAISSLFDILKSTFSIFKSPVIAGSIRVLFALIATSLKTIITIAAGGFEVLDGLFTMDFTKIKSGLGKAYSAQIGGVKDLFVNGYNAAVSTEKGQSLSAPKAKDTSKTDAANADALDKVRKQQQKLEADNLRKKKDEANAKAINGAISGQRSTTIIQKFEKEIIGQILLQPQNMEMGLDQLAQRVQSILADLILSGNRAVSGTE